MQYKVMIVALLINCAVNAGNLFPFYTFASDSKAHYVLVKYSQVKEDHILSKDRANLIDCTIEYQDGKPIKYVSQTLNVCQTDNINFIEQVYQKKYQKIKSTSSLSDNIVLWLTIYDTNKDGNHSWNVFGNALVKYQNWQSTFKNDEKGVHSCFTFKRVSNKDKKLLNVYNKALQSNSYTAISTVYMDRVSKSTNRELRERLEKFKILFLQHSCMSFPHNLINYYKCTDLYEQLDAIQLHKAFDSALYDYCFDTYMHILKMDNIHLNILSSGVIGLPSLVLFLYMLGCI